MTQLHENIKIQGYFQVLGETGAVVQGHFSCCALQLLLPSAAGMGHSLRSLCVPAEPAEPRARLCLPPGSSPGSASWPCQGWHSPAGARPGWGALPVRSKHRAPLGCLGSRSCPAAPQLLGSGKGSSEAQRVLSAHTNQGPRATPTQTPNPRQAEMLLLQTQGFSLLWTSWGKKLLRVP